MTRPLLDAPVAVRAADLGDPDERSRIDAFVRGREGSAPFHLTTWSRMVARGCGQRAHYLVAERGRGMLAGVLPLTEIASPLFGRAMVSSGFAVGGGALATGAAAETVLLDAAWALTIERRCPSLELRGGNAPGDGWSTDAATHLGFVRPLAADDEAELAAIPRKQRAEVRKALAGDLAVRIGRGRRDLAEHYRVYGTSVRNLGTPIFPRRLFVECLEQFGTDADIVTVTYRGEAVASVLSLYMNGTVYPYWGGGTLAARALRANDRMYFALMSHARSRGCIRFDFGRSRAGGGPAAFKRNWGFEPQPLVYHKRVVDGAEARDADPRSDRYARRVDLWKKLPLPVANLVGPMISRGLG